MFIDVHLLNLALELLLNLSFISRWNLLDVVIVILSIVGIALEEVESKIIPINPTIIRVMRVMRIARGTKTMRYSTSYKNKTNRTLLYRVLLLQY